VSPKRGATSLIVLERNVVYAWQKRLLATKTLSEFEVQFFSADPPVYLAVQISAPETIGLSGITIGAANNIYIYLSK
jgi:hypothetical protein